MNKKGCHLSGCVLGILTRKKTINAKTGPGQSPVSFEGCGEIEIPAFLVLLTPKEPVGDMKVN